MDDEEFPCLPGPEYKVCISGEDVPAQIDGLMVEIWRDNIHIDNATIGGFVTVGSRRLALTAATAFYPCRQTSGIDTMVIDESEFEFLEDVEWDDSMNDVPSTRIPLNPETARSPDFSASSTVKTTIGCLHFISAMTTSCDDAVLGLNWALVDITHPSIIKGNKHYLWASDPSVSEMDIHILTASGPLRSKIVSTAIVGLPADVDTPQPALVANRYPTGYGNSGTWAVRVGDHRPVGILIAKCESLRESYLLKMDDVLADIAAQTHLPVEIAPTIAKSFIVTPR
ncbi:hypothetical protein F5Y03DRAFT_398940 [Xylaria venustula]|nr:hypothetical protein F5Y03DRAFT_398940 [Xylaria venustula]